MSPKTAGSAGGLWGMESVLGTITLWRDFSPHPNPIRLRYYLPTRGSSGSEKHMVLHNIQSFLESCDGRR